MTKGTQMPHTLSQPINKHIELQAASLDIWDKKYRLKDKHGNPQENTIAETFQRVANALAKIEKKDQKKLHLVKNLM